MSKKHIACCLIFAGCLLDLLPVAGRHQGKRKKKVGKKLKRNNCGRKEEIGDILSTDPYRK
jgi:hypothetical protein